MSTDTIKLVTQIIMLFGGGYFAAHHLGLTSADVQGVVAGVVAIGAAVWKITHFNGAVAAAANQPQAVPVTKGNGLANPPLGIVLAFAGVLAFGACSGCSIIPKDVAHTLNFTEDGTKLRIGQDPVTQMPQLILGREQANVTVVPIIFQTNAATGAISAVVPDVVESYEFNGRNATFGGMSGTITFATGSNGVVTIIGGQHQPINLGTGTALPK